MLSGELQLPPSGNHFGIGARHQAAGNPVWEFHRFDWFNFHPAPMPLHYSFGSDGGRDSDELFFKSGTGAEDWALSTDSLGLTRPFRAGTAVEGVTAAATHVLDYSLGQDFAIRSTVSTGAIADLPVWLRFNGSNDYIQVSENAALKPLNDSYTFEFWARVDPGASGWNAAVEYPDGDRYYVAYNASQGWNFSVTSNSIRTDTSNHRYVARITGRWLFVQAVLDREAQRQILRVYDPGENAWHQAEVVPTAGRTEPFGALEIPSRRYPFQGDLHEMRFWRQARSQADAVGDMNQPLLGNEPQLEAYWPMNEETGTMVMDRTANANHGTFFGAPQWSTLSPVGEPGDISLSHFGSFPRFDGSVDYGTVAENEALKPMEDSYSFELWARVDPGATGWNVPIEYPGGDRYYVGYNAAQGWNFSVTTNGSRTDTHGDRYLARITGRWLFVQGVLDRQSQQQILRVYDPLEDTWHEAQVTPGSGASIPTDNLQLPSNAFPYQGDLREVRFWRAARTQAAAENDMFQPLTGDENGLAGYWPMNEGSGATAADRTANANHATFSGAPEWRAFDDRHESFSLGLVALASGNPQGTVGNLSGAFRFEWFPAKNNRGGEIFIAPHGSDGESARIDLAGFSNPPLYQPGKTYTFELSGFFNNGALTLVGTLSDDAGGEATVVQNVSNATAFPADAWFGMTARLPESATGIDWRSVEMGTPAQLGIEAPDPGLATYTSWIQEHFTAQEGADPSISGKTATPMGDGVANILKYAFGLDPRSASTNADLFNAQIRDGLLRLTYAERYLALDIEYIPQASENLTDWAGVEVIEIERIAHPEWQEFDLVTVGADVPADSPKVFLRILVRDK